MTSASASTGESEISQQMSIDPFLSMDPFLTGQAFDARAIREMSLALESVCNALARPGETEKGCGKGHWQGGCGAQPCTRRRLRNSRQGCCVRSFNRSTGAGA